MKRRLLTAVWFLVVASLGCDAIPINLPDPQGSADSGYAGPTDENPPKDAAASDVLRLPPHNAVPDALGGSPGHGDLGDAGLDGFWLPDACVGDAAGDAICPSPADGGTPEGGTGPDDGGAAPELDGP